ncbi:hypothetical protein PHYBLDRAFT_77981 [Phycomyces blakesleeanus NRRL 1555(-)]|uniref:Uncharacterized protein n=1 Tax=Phycomyces blakesleeanus (strain ATCC 8743b / DSM 1359 / FGSC 10004 / NBRC 33097 / NRRL 1555) TaxID=763407 RepID=A0A167MHZ5_PHYB8|nr:hypothetical protein PHYBLDRAFT_77981 [Phycomyces blakesleeanus NRRL 1555(-)]OAD72896.1 hypothetical protein PHYBLDRAFT_77981 [Phycomyces blakesleeanus NRRL 1555(-)]|eukprot:XP_018290936.1 hypothetical protein PHYBLDRAFT_77981 [Phycomyces blakesleeanus NRRL 1555(-)]
MSRKRRYSSIDIAMQMQRINHRPWAALLNHKVTRSLITVALLVLLLVPSGVVMKVFIQLSVILSNYPDGLIKAWSSSSIKDVFTTSQIDVHVLAASSSSETAVRVIYSPFPVCFRLSSSDNYDLFNSRALNLFLFPFSDERFWQLILCRLEHFHLGFFLIGSVNNIWLTYKILDDMFDLVLIGSDTLQDGVQVEGEEEEEEEEEEPNLPTINRRVGKLVKSMLLFHCCTLVVLFWIHFNLLAFHTDSPQNDPQTYNTRQFLAELPMWTLRWVTLGIAVGDFALRSIYRWLGRISNCVAEEEVLTSPENQPLH